MARSKRAEERAKQFITDYIRKQRNAEQRARRASNALAKLVLRPWRDVHPAVDDNHDQHDRAYWERSQKRLLRVWEKIEAALDRWFVESPGVYEIGLWAKAIGTPRGRVSDCGVWDVGGDDGLQKGYYYPYNAFTECLRVARQAALLSRRWFMASKAMLAAWKWDAYSMALKGKSATEIAATIGKATSTVSRAVKEIDPAFKWTSSPPGTVQHWEDFKPADTASIDPADAVDIRDRLQSILDDHALEPGELLAYLQNLR